MWPQFQNMLGGWQWLLIGLIPPAIVALYFLKLRRKPLEVPSTFLWRRSIEDLHVNSLWQRLRKNLLMFLQLLLVLLAILALVRPSWHGTQLVSDRSIFLVDTSASMSADDVSPTRLDEVKRQVLALIDEMGSDDVAMVISFAESAHVEQGFTGNRSALRRAVNEIEPTNEGTSLIGALELASGLANPGQSADPGTAIAEARPADLYIFSDGRFPDAVGFSLGHLEPQFVPIGSSESENVGILAFSTRHNEEKLDKLSAFARVANFSPQERTLYLSLYRDGGPDPADDELVDSYEATLPAAEFVIDESAPPSGEASERTGLETTAKFQPAVMNVPLDLPAGAALVDESGSGRLELRLEMHGASGELVDLVDNLAADNRAWTVVDVGRRANVLYVRDDNPFVDQALKTDGVTLRANVQFEATDYLKSDEYQRQAQTGHWDLIIYDGCVPPPPEDANGQASGPAMPAANTLFIGTLPPGASEVKTATAAGGENDPVPDAGGDNGAQDGDNPPPDEAADPEPDGEPDEDTAPDTAKGTQQGSADAKTWWQRGAARGVPKVIHTERAHPLMQLVEMGNVLIAEGFPLSPPPGATVLVESNHGPLVAVASRGIYEDAVIGFSIVSGDEYGTDWPKKLSFPVFFLNVVQYLGGSRSGAADNDLRPGDSITISASRVASDPTIEKPSGERLPATSSGQLSYVFSQTDELGIYTVSDSERTVRCFAVNLFRPSQAAAQSESNIQPRPANDEERMFIRIGHTDVEGKQVVQSARREGWKWLVLAALVVLLVEWYIYNRRVYL